MHPFFFFLSFLPLTPSFVAAHFFCFHCHSTPYNALFLSQDYVSQASFLPFNLTGINMWVMPLQTDKEKTEDERERAPSSILNKCQWPIGHHFPFPRYGGVRHSGLRLLVNELSATPCHLSFPVFSLVQCSHTFLYVFQGTKNETLFFMTMVKVGWVCCGRNGLTFFLIFSSPPASLTANQSTRIENIALLS